MNIIKLYARHLVYAGRTIRRGALITVSDQAREVLRNAIDEASDLRHPFLGTEHLLLALIDEPSLTELFAASNIKREMIREKVKALGAARPDACLPILFSGRAKRVMQLAEDEARMSGTRRIEPRHILAGLLLEGQGVGGRALAQAGISLASVRARGSGDARP